MDTVEVQIKNQKKKIYIAIFSFMTLMVLAVVALVIFYEYRLRAILGSASMAPKTDIGSIISQMFAAKLTSENIAAGEAAMKIYGYTENGFSYLFNQSGQWIIIMVMLAILVAATGVCVKAVSAIGKKDIYAQVFKTIRENEKLNREMAGNVEFFNKRNKQMQNFIENIAHQIKTPLAAINIALDTIKERNSDNRLDIYIDQCLFHSERIRGFIRRLLNISRMEAGKIVFAKDCIMVSDVVNQAVQAVPVTSAKLEKVPDSDYAICGDEEWLCEALLAIMGNSCEHVQDLPGGGVFVDIDYGQEKCVIKISDNGKGLKTSDLNKIFDRFESSGDEKSLHVGIGLNFAKLVVQAHHGKISAGNSEKYGGAEFRVTLPQYKLKQKNVVL